MHNAQIFECNHFLACFLVCWKDATAVFLIPLWRDEKKVDCSCLIRSALCRVEAQGRRRFLRLEESSFFPLLSLFCSWPRYTDVPAAAGASPSVHAAFNPRYDCWTPALASQWRLEPPRYPAALCLSTPPPHPAHPSQLSLPVKAFSSCISKIRILITSKSVFTEEWSSPAAACILNVYSHLTHHYIDLRQPFTWPSMTHFHNHT